MYVTHCAGCAPRCSDRTTDGDPVTSDGDLGADEHAAPTDCDFGTANEHRGSHGDPCSSHRYAATDGYADAQAHHGYAARHVNPQASGGSSVG